MRSLDKYVPNRVSIETIEDKQMDITIKLPKPTDGSEITYDRLQKAFETWKAAQPLNKKDDDDDNATQKPQPKPPHPQAPTVLTDVEAKLIAWPLEQHSPIETINFVADLKKELTMIFTQGK